DYGCTLATIPATVTDRAVPAVALLAHVDTAPAFSGTNVRPIVHRNYDGNPITLPDDPAQVLRAEEFPLLASKIGEDIVTASGTTLLGADDKAGVAIIMATAAYLLAHPELPHGPVRVCFTSDEEIGTGIRRLPLDDLAADVAYTLDGGDPGEIAYETFSADKAVVTITGVSTHPGDAFGVMVNALHLAAKLLGFLPAYTRTPETTQDRQGFIHVYQMKGTAAEAELHFILRDFELAGLQAHGDFLRAACQALALAEPRARVNCALTPQYRNMRYWLENDMTPVRLAEAAIRRAGLTPISKPTRGGTDGSQLTERGVPTPNLFTGMQNVHGPLEWVSLQDMARATAVCVELLQLWADPSR
ncbi:MAG TPA: peptidase T, partial [Caldilineaceae bacterium]|nr:peptidase T [Caldilineaceae bacterium]